MVGGYVRVSTLAQKDNWSVSVQKQRAIEFAKSHNEPIELYDEVKSGRSLERPELSRLIRDIESGKITKVWVVEFSRLSRDPEHSAYLSKLFRQYKVELYVLDAFIDLTKSDVRFTYNINAAVNAKSSDDTSERVIRTKAEQKKAGAFVHSTLFGYKREFDIQGNSVWKIDENEAQVIKRIFQQYNGGISLARIARELESEKVPQRRGKKWAATTVIKLLQHPEYFGLTKNENGQLVKSIVYEAILDPDDWGKLSYQKAARKEARDRFRVAKSELSGLIACGYCGARYYVNRNGKYVRYSHKCETEEQLRCRQKPKYFDVAKTNELIQNLYEAVFSQRDHVVEFLKTLKDQIYQTENELEEARSRVEKELEEIEVQRKRLVDAVAEGLLSAGDIREKVSDLNAQKTEKQRIIEAYKEKLELFDLEYYEVGAKFSDDTINRFKNADVDEKRKMYRDAIKRITVRGTKVQIEFITGKEFYFRIGEWEWKEDKSRILRGYLKS